LDDPIMKKQVKDLTYADARLILDEIMRQYRADRIEDSHLRQHIFDTIVNHPPKLGIRMWQRALNESGFLPKGEVLEEDGTLGPATRAAVNGLTAAQRRTLNEALVDKRVEFYRDFIRRHPEKKELEEGLIIRANSFRLP
jgi:lysozyme family protein